MTFIQFYYTKEGDEHMFFTITSDSVPRKDDVVSLNRGRLWYGTWKVVKVLWNCYKGEDRDPTLDIVSAHVKLFPDDEAAVRYVETGQPVEFTRA